MAGRPLYNLPNATTVESGDKFLIQQGVSSKQVDKDVLLTAENTTKSGGGSVQDFIDSQTFPNVTAMLAFNELSVGHRYSTGGTIWEYLGGGGLIDNFEALTSVNVKDFGAVGNGIIDDTQALLSAFALGGKVVAPSDKTYIVDSNVINVTLDNIYIDFNGSSIKLATQATNGLPAIRVAVNGYGIVENLTVDADNKSDRPFELFGNAGAELGKAVNVKVNNTYASAVGTLSCRALGVVGYFKNIETKNIEINNVDSAVGRNNTCGLLAGRSVASDEGFLNCIVENVVLTNITQEGGTATSDSDGVKVFGAIGINPFTGSKSSATIDNVSQVNASGLNCKRIIKTQCGMYDVNNINGTFSNCEVYSFIDNQYGAGTTKGVNLNLDTVVITNSIVSEPQFVTSDSPNDSSSTTSNVSVDAVNTTAYYLFPSFLGTDRSITRKWSEWTVKGVEYSALGVLEVDNDDSFIELTNINLSESTSLTGVAFEGAEPAPPLGVNYVKGVLCNVSSNRVLNSGGVYSGSGTIYTRIVPVSVNNCDIRFEGFTGGFNKILARPTYSNGVSSLSAAIQKTAGPHGTTRLTLTQGLGLSYAQIAFKYKTTKTGGNISNVSFTVGFNSTPAPVIYELSETFIGVRNLAGPSVTYDDITNELQITFSQDDSTTKSCSVDITSNCDFTLLSALGLGAV